MSRAELFHLLAISRVSKLAFANSRATSKTVGGSPTRHRQRILMLFETTFPRLQLLGHCHGALVKMAHVLTYS